MLQWFASISNTIHTEATHWQHQLWSSSSSSPSYSFLQNVPYLSEVGHHFEIIKKEPVMRRCNGLQKLSQDVLYVVLSFLDCRSLVHVSLCSSWYYHMSHEEHFWAQWLHLESMRLCARDPSFLHSSGTLSDDESDTLLLDEDSLTQHHQPALDQAHIRALNAFYQPSPEEEIYARFHNLPHILQQRLQNDSLHSTMSLEDPTNTAPDELTVFEELPDELTAPYDYDNAQQHTASPSPSEYPPHLTEYYEMLRQHHDALYSSYLNFRKLKLRNPFIRSRLIRIYTHDLKERYAVLTRWILHGKLLATLALTIGTVFLSLQLDTIIDWWWPFVFFPFVVFALLSAALSTVLWMPTLYWPISLYRWLAKEYVGCWTSWAYSLSQRARWIQVFFGIWMPCTVFVGFAHVTAPSFIPKWAIFAWMAIGFLIWSYTPTQFLNIPSKSFYSIMLFLINLNLVFFCVLVVLKMALVNQLLQAFPLLDFYWSIPFIMLVFALAGILVVELKLGYDLNRAGNTRLGPCAWICWEMLFMVVFGLVAAFVIMLWIKLEITYTRALPVLVRSSMDELHYFYIFLPVELIECMAIVYYSLRCYTKKIDSAVLKFPWMMSGGKWTLARSLGNNSNNIVV